MTSLFNIESVQSSLKIILPTIATKKGRDPRHFLGPNYAIDSGRRINENWITLHYSYWYKQFSNTIPTKNFHHEYTITGNS